MNFFIISLQTNNQLIISKAIKQYLLELTVLDRRVRHFLGFLELNTFQKSEKLKKKMDAFYWIRWISLRIRPLGSSNFITLQNLKLLHPQKKTELSSFKQTPTIFWKYYFHCISSISRKSFFISKFQTSTEMLHRSRNRYAMFI